MFRMNEFLRSSQSSLKSHSTVQMFHIVMGNESCDLDSAISALAYAYLLHRERSQTATCSCKNSVSIPIFNIPRSDFPLKTEVTYILAKKQIQFSDLVFRDEVDLDSLHGEGKLKLYLVDSHTLPTADMNLISAVNGILDHRPQEPDWTWKDVEHHIELTGSCCTLVTREIAHRCPDILREIIGELLHATIVLDTVNFSTSAKRSTAVDVEMTELLEKNHEKLCDHEQIFNELLDARRDISTLTSLQLLCRDLKLLNNVSLPGLPILVRDFVKRHDAADAFRDFCQLKKTCVLVPMGLVINDGIVTRDLAIFSNNLEIGQPILVALKSCESPNLGLEERPTNIENFVLFSQSNTIASRKQILPIIKKVLASL